MTRAPCVSRGVKECVLRSFAIARAHFGFAECEQQVTTLNEISRTGLFEDLQRASVMAGRVLVGEARVRPATSLHCIADGRLATGVVNSLKEVIRKFGRMRAEVVRIESLERDCDASVKLG